MYNQFGTGTINVTPKASPEQREQDDTERYLTELIAGFSRARAEKQAASDGAGPEKEQTQNRQTSASDEKELYLAQLQELNAKLSGFEAKLREMRSLQEELKRVESEREELARRLDEIEKKNIRSEEDLKSVLSEKKKIEERNQQLQSANTDALDRIRVLTQEKEEAELSENEALEMYLRQIKENDNLAAELDNLRSINEKLSGEMDREYEATRSDRESAEQTRDSSEEQYRYSEADAGDEFEKKYGQELVTDSGRELFMMLRGLLQDDARDDNGVRMTRSWEEEMEETIPGQYPDDTPITRKVRTKSEVSVEYIAGHRNGI